MADVEDGKPWTLEDVGGGAGLVPRPVTHDEARAMLAAAGRRVVLAEYFTIGDEVVLFCIRSDGEEPQAVRLRLDRDELRRFAITTFGQASSVRELAAMGLEELWHGYDYLVEPLARWAEPDDLVVLVPHGLLHYLPLHALRVDGDYLIVRNVGYAPSASVLNLCRHRHTVRSPRLGHRAAVFGDPRGDLPYAREEAIAVATALGTSAKLGNAVTHKAFAQTVAGAEVVHFAGHAIFDQADAMASRLQLANRQSLTAQQVQQLDGFRPQVVTLSGCETGVNARRPGDELIGFTRALLSAGAHSLVVSQWRVPDDSTARLMVRFYERLYSEAGVTKADALRQAILDSKADGRWSSLYHWAPFILVGDWE